MYHKEILKHDFDNDIEKLNCPELSYEDDKKIWSTRIWVSRNIEGLGHTLTEN